MLVLHRNIKYIYILSAHRVISSMNRKNIRETKAGRVRWRESKGTQQKEN
jgi:hypothetical protein